MHNHFPKTLIARNLGFRVIAILCFTVGMVSTWNWQTETPSTQFLVHLQPEPETIIQNRNLEDYEFGGIIPMCFDNFEFESRNCRMIRREARDFILKHWREKNRAYLISTCNTYHGSDYYIFIEPDNNGRRRFVGRTWAYSDHRGFSTGTSMTIAYSVKTKIAAEDDPRYLVGRTFLVFIDKDGKEAFHF